MLLLNPENYLNQNINIKGKIKEIGPLDMWFVLEDESGYIQVTTENISEKVACLQVGKPVFAIGKLQQFSVHKYFALSKNLKCK